MSFNIEKTKDLVERVSEHDLLEGNYATSDLIAMRDHLRWLIKRYGDLQRIKGIVNKIHKVAHTL